LKNNKKKRPRAFRIRELATGRESRRSGARAEQPKKPAAQPKPLDPALAGHLQRAKWAGLAVLVVLFFWGYWPTIVELVRAWDREPDYSHGFLVVPLAAFVAWARRDWMPAVDPRLAWGGLVLIVLAAGIRAVAAGLYIDSMDGWSIVVWVGGVVWLLAGRQVFAWASPAIAFLWFMVPLPFRAESLISYPLQRVATKLSCWMLQFLGQPALAEGNTILMGEHRLAVEEACSGLRIFMSIVALAFVYVVVIRRSWWEKLLVLASTLPIALIVNAMRVVATGMLAQYASSEAAAKFSHDLAGWVMIPLAAAFFGAVVWYLGRLFPLAQRIDIRSVVRRDREHFSTANK